LLSWQAAVERQFRFDPSAPLPQNELLALGVKYRQRQQFLESELSKGAGNLRELTARAELDLGPVLSIKKQIAQAEADLSVFTGGTTLPTDTVALSPAVLVGLVVTAAVAMVIVLVIAWSQRGLTPSGTKMSARNDQTRYRPLVTDRRTNALNDTRATSQSPQPGPKPRVVSTQDAPSASPPPMPSEPAPEASKLETNSLHMKFAWIPPGSFLMGSPTGEVGRFEVEMQHRVTLTKGFYMGVYPVTQAEWQAVMGSNPSLFPGDSRPVERVSWNECQEFCRKLSAREGKTYRLPTEAEFEYACRAGTATAYCFGDDLAMLGEYAWFYDNSE
jgi:hypothetical protein